MEELYSLHTILFYLVGIAAFWIANIDDIHEHVYQKYQWLQTTLLTLVAITVGVLVCAYLDAKPALYWLVSIACGFLGGSILGKIDARKKEIGDAAVDTIKKKIENFSSSDITNAINSRTNNKTVEELEKQENILQYSTIDASNTFIDNEQSDYNPFESGEFDEN